MSDTGNQSNTEEQAKPAEFQKPGNAVMNIYSFATIPSSWARGTQSNWYNYFMTNVLLLSPALSGTISLISRLCGLFSQPIAGGILDSIQIKGRKYATWIQIMVPFSMLTCFLLFLNYTQMGLSTAAITVLVIVLYTSGLLIAAFPNVAHLGLYAVMVQDHETRIKLTTRRALGLSGGNITLGMLAMPLVAFFGRGDEARGFFYTILLFCTTGLFGYYLITFVTKPWDPVGSSAEVKKGPPPPKIRDLFAAIFTNPPLASMLVSDAFRWASRNMMVGFAMYNFRYVFGSMMLMAGFMTSMNLVSFVSTIISEPVTRKFGKDAVYIYGNAFLMLTMIAAFLFSNGNAMVYIVIICIGHIGYGPSAALPPAYYAECADWSLKKTGKDSKTLIMSIYNFCSAIGGLIATTLTGYTLAAIGFNARAEVTPDIVTNIFRIACLGPIILLFIAIVVFLIRKTRTRYWFGDQDKV